MEVRTTNGTLKTFMACVLTTKVTQVYETYFTSINIYQLLSVWLGIHFTKTETKPINFGFFYIIIILNLNRNQTEQKKEKRKIKVDSGGFSQSNRFTGFSHTPNGNGIPKRPRCVFRKRLKKDRDVSPF